MHKRCSLFVTLALGQRMICSCSHRVSIQYGPAEECGYDKGKNHDYYTTAKHDEGALNSHT